MGSSGRHSAANVSRMDLFTRCPHCETVFRVTTRHLQASGGQVRCGRCHSVFDAFASLTAKPPGESQRLSGDEEPQPPSQQTGPTPPDAQATTQQIPLAASAEGVKSDTQAAPSEPVHDDRIEYTPRPDLTPRQRVGKTATSDPATNLFEWEFKPAPALRRTGLWLTLSLLLLICAVVQVGYIFRTELMVRYPQLKPVYQLACEQFSCEIELPRLADQLNIDASDLQFIDPGKPNIVQLTALVRNRARVPVEYPAFELTLTNAQQQVVARRIFAPVDYLDDPATAEAGLGGRQELVVNLYLDTGPLRAAGYRIYLFYPPPT